MAPVGRSSFWLASLRRPRCLDLQLVSDSRLSELRAAWKQGNSKEVLLDVGSKALLLLLGR
jgi:hypothetical protein